MSEAVEPRPLSENELREIIKRAIESEEESKLILVLETWTRQGPSFIDEQIYEVVCGEIEEIKLERIEEPYPYRSGARVALIPKTIPTIVLVERRDNTASPEIHKRYIYVFTKDGWKRVEVQ